MFNSTRLLGSVALGLGLWVVLCLALVTPAWGQSVHREPLANGLTLIIDNRSDTHVVELRVHVAAGPMHEGALLGSGVSAVTRELVQDAIQRGDLDIDRFLIAGDVRSELSVGGTSYALTTTDRHVPSGLAALAKLVAWRGADDEAIQRARARILEQVVARTGDAAAFEASRIDAIAMRSHPARLPVNGLMSLVGSLEPADQRRFHNAHYTAPNTTVIIVGNIEPVAARAMVDAAFAGLPAGGWMPTPSPVEPPQYKARHAQIEGPVAQERHVYAWRTVGYEFRDQAILTLVAELMAGADDAPLVRALADSQAANQLAVTNVAAPDRPGFLRIAYTPFQGRSADAWIAVEQVLTRFIQQGPELDQLAAAKQRLLRQRLLDRMSVAKVAVELERWQRAIAEPSSGTAFYGEIESAGIEDIRDVCLRLLEPNGINRSQLIISPIAADAVVAPMKEPGVALSDVAPTVIKDLPGGVRCVHHRLPTGLAHLRLTMAGGVASDGEAHRGLSMVLARVLEAGPLGRSEEDLHTLLRKNGMKLSTQADMHSIHVTITCFPEQVALAVDLLADIMKQPALPEAVVARVVQDLQADLTFQSDGDNWQATLLQGVRRTMLDGHYAGADWRGTRETLATIDRSLLQSHHNSSTSGRRVVFSLYGKIDVDAAVQQLRQRLDSEPQVIAGEPWRPQGSGWGDVEVANATTITWERATDGAVALAWPGPSLADLQADQAALDIISAMLLGTGRTGGRLADALKEREVSTQALEIVHEAYAGRGLMVLHALMANDERESVTAALTAAVQALSKQLELTAEDELALSDDEISLAKDRSIARRMLNHETPQAAQRDHVQAMLTGVGLQHHLAYRKRVEAVTRNDLQRVIKTYLDGTPTELRLVPAGAAVPEQPVVPEPVDSTDEAAPPTVQPSQPPPLEAAPNGDEVAP